MQTVLARPGNARTFLTHMFGCGLEEDRYVVERFQAMADGDIRRWPGGGSPTKKNRPKEKPTVVSLKTVKDMRPARNEIIVCTGLRTKGGVRIWGDLSTGLFVRRRQR